LSFAFHSYLHSKGIAVSSVAEACKQLAAGTVGVLRNLAIVYLEDVYGEKSS